MDAGDDAPHADEPPIVVKLENLLWRTRGRHWDYDFVLRPREPAWREWYPLYREVFEGLTPEEHAEPTLRHGYVIAPPQLWVATAFHDASRRDEAGRAIVHGLMWFPPAKDHPRLARIPRDWGVQIVRALEARTDPAFAMAREALQSSTAVSARYVEAAADQHEVALQGPSVELEGEGLGVLLKKKPDARLELSARWWVAAAMVLMATLTALLLSLH